MEKEAHHTALLDLTRVPNNNWNKSDFDNLKKSKGYSKSFRGSQIVKDVVSGLRLRTIQPAPSSRVGDEPVVDQTYNTIFQRYYGESYAEFLDLNRVPIA